MKHDKTTHDFSTDSLYDRYTVALKFRHRLYGGVPKNPDLLAGWIAARTEHNDKQTADQVEVAKAALGEAPDNMTVEKSWVGFFADDVGGLWTAANNIKAMLKQSASMLGILKKKRGSKQIVCEGMEVKGIDDPMRIYLDAVEPDGYEERPIHVQTAQGPRTAIKRVDYVQDKTMAFQIWVLKTAPAETRHIGETEIVAMLRFSQENGLGGDRSQGGGKFDVIEFAKIAEDK